MSASYKLSLSVAINNTLTGDDEPITEAKCKLNFKNEMESEVGTRINAKVKSAVEIPVC
jgi:hypothetical protein